MSYISGIGTLRFLRPESKNRKKSSYIFRKWNSPAPNIKKKNYISGNNNPKKLLLFQEVTFHARKKNLSGNKSLILRERETPKKFLIFSQKKAFF